jgi:hypothetical protein
VGNRRARELMLRQAEEADWARVRTEPRPAHCDVHARGIGARRLQLIVAPSFEEVSVWEMRQGQMLAFKDCFVVGSHPANAPLLEKYARGRVELRPHEQMQLDLGLETDEIKAAAEWKFPEEKSAVTPEPPANGQGPGPV